MIRIKKKMLKIRKMIRLKRIKKRMLMMIRMKKQVIG